jgi:hypothetical protein
MSDLPNNRYKSIKLTVDDIISYDDIKLVVTYEEEIKDDALESKDKEDISNKDININDESVSKIMDAIFSSTNKKSESSTDLESVITYGLENGYVNFRDLMKLDYDSEEVEDRFEAIQILDNKNIEIIYD